jgi:membrane-associated phospholipid phosphatase
MTINHDQDSSKPPSKSKIKSRLFLWFIIFILGITLEIIFRETLYKTGIKFIKILQTGIQGNELLIKFYQFLSFMATKNAVIIIAILFFNYLDMYTTLILVIIAGSGSIGTGLFKLIYKNPRPFFHEDWVRVYDCETGYGNPSGHSILAVSIYLTLWKVLRKRNNFFERNKKKIFWVLFAFICLILSSRLALGAHSLNQILLGSFIGYQTYLLFFYVIKIELQLQEEIKVVMNITNFKILLFILSFILVSGIIIFNFFPLNINLDVHKYLERILKDCPGTPYSKTFDYEAYFMLAACSSLIGAYCGIIYDVKINLSNSIETWIEMNQGKNLWNSTGCLKSIKRLILTILLLIIPFSLNFIVSSHAHTNYIFIIKNFIPFMGVNFVLFGFGRHVAFLLNCTNEKYKSK